MKLLTNGCNRLVLLIGRFAIKVPRFDLGWERGINGLLCNMQENRLSGLPSACPVLFHIPGGFMTIMQRCEPLMDDEWNDYKMNCVGFWIHLPVEFKRCSFGKLEGKIVAVDYGS